MNIEEQVLSREQMAHLKDFRRETAARVMCVLVGQTDITRLIEKDVCERITDRAIYFTDKLIEKLN